MFLQKFQSHPKKLFVIDGIGALLSALLLGVVLVRFENLFGIPARFLYFLAAFPLLFACYDFYAYRRLNTAFLLKGIALLNYFYCGLSLSIALRHMDSITSLGWIYMWAELGIVFVLATVEFGVGKKMIKHHKPS